MSTAVTNWTIAAALLIVALLCLAGGLCRVSGRAARAEELGELTVWDFAAERWMHLPPGAKPGPGQMTLRQIERSPQLELTWLAPAYGEKAAASLDAALTRMLEELGPPRRVCDDPALAEGCERLWDAIRDTNTTEGDQSS
jgi:hypothetical protein